MERYFKCMAGHNTVQIDKREPIELVSRFLFLPWPKARMRHYEPRGAKVGCIECEHYGYDRKGNGVLHRRTLIGLAGDTWLVVDDLLGKGEHEATLRWHLIDAQYKVNDKDHVVTLATSEGDLAIHVTGSPAMLQRFEIVYGRDRVNQVQGFASPHYGTKSAIPTLEADVSFMNIERLITVVSPGKTTGIELTDRLEDHEQWQIHSDEDAWIVELSLPSRSAPRVFLDRNHRPKDEAVI